MTKTATKKKTAKKTKVPTIHMAVLLDESGSMELPYGPGVEVVVEETNSFIESLRGAEAEGPVRASLAMFDAVEPRVRLKYDAPLDEVPMLTLSDFNPRGGTPLNDAIVETINRVGKGMKKGDRAMVVIFTDGRENSSETPTSAVRELIEAKEKEGFAFIYLGANQDAFDEASQRGLGAKGQSFDFTATQSGTRSAMRRTSNLAVGYVADHASYPVAAAAMSQVIPEDEDSEVNVIKGENVGKPKVEATEDATSTAADYLKGSS